MSSSAVTRKRSRAQIQEHDELGPEKDIAPLSSAKKRKLNTYGSSPANGSRFGSIKRTIGGLFNFGKNGKENLLEEEEEEEEQKDELADDSDDNDVTIGKRKKDIWEIEVSDPDETTSTRRRGSERNRLGTNPRTVPKSAKATKERSSTKSKTDKGAVDASEDDIWEVPDSPPRHIGRNSTTMTERTKALLVPAVTESSPKKQLSRRGRPRKSDILKQAKKLSNMAVREKMMAAGEDDASDEEDEESTLTSTRKQRGKAAMEDAAIESSILSAKASTGRKRGRPPKTKLAGVIEPQQAPKSILTPAKQRTGRGRTSVSFDVGDEVHLGFKDLPVSASTARAKKSKQLTEGARESPASKLKQLSAVRQGAEEEEEDAQQQIEEDAEEVESEDIDDEMCELCSGLESTKKNPIMFCDGEDCDFAVHRECYQVAKVPKGDWFCRDCQLEAGHDVLFTQLETKDTGTENLNIPEIEGHDGHLRHIQRVLLDRFTGQKSIILRGHDEELQKVHQVVEQTVLAGEGNSMLVIGARGCGKTTLVESVISDLSKNHRESFHVVRLNGFIHTDDKLALKETWRQLGREMELEDEVASKTSNYSDTLASLLALLSHPSEISDSQTEQTAKSVIFILDEFDLFTTHPRQTLLYNLFDIAQARKAPIVVLGLTTRVDVVESLEKRVKSRFSHRYVHLSLPRSLPAFWDICKAGLLIEADELYDESLGSGDSGQDELLSFWQSMIEDLYNKDAIFKHHVQSEFYRSKSITALFTSFIIPIANLSLGNLPLTGKRFTNFLSAPDSKLPILRGLSELELALLIAAARLDIILDTDTCNFAMAYDEYSSLTSRYKIQTSSTGVAALGASAKVWGREVASGAWERLAEYGLLVPAGIGGGAGRDFGAGGRMWKIDVGLEEITGSVDGLSGVMAKWCREI